MEEYAIQIDSVSKVYRLYQKPADRLKEALKIGKKYYHKDFYALNDISFKIAKNQAVGIIGTNGSGKSTLLKLICGVLSATSGAVTVNGRISALLELGAGFNPEYTGIENIHLNGTLMGYQKEEIKRKIPEILSFADIGDFINQPVKTYSSGMFARLAFAVAINVEPEILVVDEALSVGDIRFQQKCFRKIEEMKKYTTVLMVSHDLGAISKFCDTVIWIEKGEMKGSGDPTDMIREYQAYLMDSRLSPTVIHAAGLCSGHSSEMIRLIPVTEKFKSYGSMESEIVGFNLMDAATLEPVEYVRGGQDVIFYLRVEHHKAISNAIAGITIYDRLSNCICGMNSFLVHSDIECDETDVIYSCHFRMPELNSGTYTISPAIAEGTQSNHVMRHWVFDACSFQMITPFERDLEGVLAPYDYYFQINRESRK